MTPAPLLHARRPSAYVLTRRNDALTRALREAQRAHDKWPLRFLAALVLVFLVCTLWRAVA